MKAAVDEKLREEQSWGFGKDRSTIDQIVTLRVIVGQSIEWNSSLLDNFIDYQKAFDSMDRAILWKIMRHHGTPGKLVILVRELYEGSSCRVGAYYMNVSHECQLIESFDIITGVKQGYIPSAFIFFYLSGWLVDEGDHSRKTLWYTVDTMGPIGRPRFCRRPGSSVT